MINTLPYISSELLEPYLTHFFSIIINMIGQEEAFPSVEKWTKWHHMLYGVHLFIIRTGAIHANIAISSELNKIDPFWPTKEFDKEKAMLIWRIAKETIKKE